MTNPLTSRIARRWLGGAGLGLTLTLGLGACDSILEVNDPDIITDASSAAGAQALRTGTFLRFSQALDGGGDAPDGLFLYTGLVADEWQSGDTFTQRNQADTRAVAVNNSFVNDLYRRVNRIRTQGREAVDALRQFAPIPAANIGQMFALIAYAENQIGEAFCNGVAFSEVDGSVITFGNPVPYDSAFRRAVNHSDSALANVSGSADSSRVRQLAAVIKGRALLNRNNPAAAATAVANVSTSFVYQSTHSANANDNAMWLQNISLRRYVMGNGEGTNGMPFRSANDPRIPPGPTNLPPLAFDGVAPTVAQGIWVNRTDPVTIASGIEARLIEAEAALRANDVTNFLAKLNVARATKAGLSPLTDPGTQAAREDLLFRERAFWLFGTGHRLGDLRRLIRQYGRGAETVFPTGTWFKGGPYSTDVNLPIPQDEENNPNATGCTDRNP